MTEHPAETRRARSESKPSYAGTSWPKMAGALAGDVVIPLVAFYGLRGAQVNQWLALVLASLAPAATVAVTWVRQRRWDPMGTFVIVAMTLSLAVALVTGDPRTLLARESWITGLFGVWVIGSLATSRPFLLDIVIKLSTPELANRLAHLWQHSAVFHRWMRTASLAWGAAFLLDAGTRVLMAYTLPVDSVPLLGVVLLIAALVIAQGASMLLGRRSGALKLLKPGSEVISSGESAVVDEGAADGDEEASGGFARSDIVRSHG
ncbi:VC0807 family protein [Streptomyces sp. NPDC059970]|uniref:VC0807 family protein n=1 Tax=Streptomyces sp. NPDC059970 TaxID=3347019 RepID=UPI0036AD0845